MRKFCALIGVVAVVASANVTTAQERIIEQNGVRYVERTEPVQTATSTVTFERQERTDYEEQYRTSLVETQQTVLVPVTEYQWEPRVHHWWNPLVPNTIAYHMVPRTRWEARPHTVRTPQTVREVVEVKRTVMVPRRELGFQNDRRTTLTAIGPASSSPTAVVRSAPATSPPQQIARQPQYIGGVQQMEGDLPRQGTRAGDTIRYR